jgi:parvulin-like peptidyl-prolyl isomerase
VTSTLRAAAFLALAACGGVAAGFFVSSSAACRNAIGLRMQRGALVATVEGVGIYEGDVDRAEAEWDDRNPDSTGEPDPAERTKIIDALIANLRAERLGQNAEIPAALIDRQLELERFQFQPKAWLPALRTDGLSPRAFHREIAGNLRAQSWIEKTIRPLLAVSAQECAAEYEAHPDAYTQPFRIRVSHIFFAAPPGSTPELVETKRSAAQAIVDRISGGEKFAELVVHSEDEASKKHGGDLGFFGESRVPADFWSAVKGIPVGAPASVIRTSLGFHVVEVSDARPPRQISLEEARAGILLALENERRVAAVKALTTELARGVR